jgi:hypothetical protein
VMVVVVVVALVKTKATKAMISVNYEIHTWRFNDENCKCLLYFSPSSEPKANPVTSFQEEQHISKVYIYIYVILLASSSILFQPFNRPQSCLTKRNTRKSHLYYFICPVTSLLHTGLRLQSSRMWHHVVGRWVPCIWIPSSPLHWRWRQQVSANVVPIYLSTKCHITEDHTLNIHQCKRLNSHVLQNMIILSYLWYWFRVQSMLQFMNWNYVKNVMNCR